MRILVIGLMLFLALGVVAQAKEPERPRCENCGMFTDISSTNVHAMLKIDGKEAEHNFVCLECVYEFMHEKAKGAKLTGLKVLDYTTFGTKTPQFIDGMTAWYLVGTKPLKGSMEPYIAAFATKDAATKAKKTLSGELKNYTDTWATFAADEGTPGSAGEDEYVCPMCSDVHSDKPGDCPNCGMKLVKKEE
jgi:rubrerythrin